MKKLLNVLVVALLASAGMLAPGGLSAQQRTVKVQGHPHESLTINATQGAARTAVSAVPGGIDYVNPDSIKYWVDEPRLNPYNIDSAYLIIRFTDDVAFDSMYVWGYRYNADTPHHGIDLLRAVANNDKRLLVMLQYAGKLGHEVGGIGINWRSSGADCSRPDLMLDVDAASADPDVRFVYTNGGTPDCADGQVATPTGASNIANFATVDMMRDGILEHPFDAGYGYPAYDYDHWIFNPYVSHTGWHWQAGLNKNGIWKYYRADNRRVPVPTGNPDKDPDAALLSVTYEPLLNQQVHGFVFDLDFKTYRFDLAPLYVTSRCAPCAATSASPAVTGLSAQENVVKAQGHPHEVLTQKAAEGTAKRAAVAAAPTDTVYIDPAAIQCWIDEPGLDPSLRVDSTILAIKFTDDKEEVDSLFVWGYRWNPVDEDGDSVAHHGIDMLRTVANNDKRLITMLQYSGLYGHSVGGIGLNWNEEVADCSRSELDFDIAGAQHNDPDSVEFSYFSPNKYCSLGQVAVPVNANNSTTFAKLDHRRTGILPHPFGAKFGYPAYDFDYWNLASTYLQQYRHWQAGWVAKGYWAYYRADNWRLPIPTGDYFVDPDAAQLGVTYEPLKHRQVQGFVYFTRIPQSKYDYNYATHYFDGEMIFVDCGCPSCTTK